MIYIYIYMIWIWFAFRGLALTKQTRCGDCTRGRLISLENLLLSACALETGSTWLMGTRRIFSFRKIFTLFYSLQEFSSEILIFSKDMVLKKVKWICIANFTLRRIRLCFCCCKNFRVNLLLLLLLFFFKCWPTFKLWSVK